jgi:hypothetical protein
MQGMASQMQQMMQQMQAQMPNMPPEVQKKIFSITLISTL